MPITALIVRVPEAEALVGDLRTRFDPTASIGVPAHVTLLVPFMPPEAAASQLTTLRSIFSNVVPFTFCLAQVGRWPATTYLKPEPAEPFITLTRELAAAFPGYPPYEGRFSDIVPHLTVADGNMANADNAEVELRRLVASTSPVVSACNEIALFENTAGIWKCMHSFRVGAQ